MRSVIVSILLGLCVAVGAVPQTGVNEGARRQKSRPASVPTTAVPQTAMERKQPPAQKPAHLISVPVVVKDSEGRYVSDLQQSDFEIYEDDVKRSLASFEPVTAPVSIVLLLDTSISTQDQLANIRRAAHGFVDKLQETDRVKLITFDDQIREMNDFTADRAIVKTAIRKAESGYNTKFYDAMNVALESLREIDGRKAIVIFSDGVDYRSDYASAESTLRWLEQDGVLVYPIRFSTRLAAERKAREQAGEPLPTREVSKTTSATPEPFPGTTPGPTPRGEPRTGPLGLPLPDDILRRRRDSRRDDDRVPTTERPPAGEVGSDVPTGRGTRPSRRDKPAEDKIGGMLDRLYISADNYLKALAEKSGGELFRADTVTDLPGAFSQVATELRAQYTLTFAPTNKTADSYYAIKITSHRPGLIVRARPGYRPRG